jgi:hypothetical protein
MSEAQKDPSFLMRGHAKSGAVAHQENETNGSASDGEATYSGLRISAD